MTCIRPIYFKLGPCRICQTTPIPAKPLPLPELTDLHGYLVVYQAMCDDCARPRIRQQIADRMSYNQDIIARFTEASAEPGCDDDLIMAYIDAIDSLERGVSEMRVILEGI